MSQRTLRTDLGADTADRLVRVARTSLGDTLRSVVYFTPAAFDVLYVRTDLYGSTEAAREAKGQLVEFERVGFAELPVRTVLADESGRSSIGGYAFTVRFHEDGFVVRVLQDGAGVLLTADSMDVGAFEHAVGAIRTLLG
jgi:hypothetical protein